MGFTSASLAGIDFDVLSTEESKRQKTLKHTIGRVVAILGPSLGSNALERVLRITGQLRGSVATRDTTRTNLQALEDGERHQFVNGVQNGDYAIMPGTLIFPDDGTTSVSVYRFSMELVEW